MLSTKPGGPMFLKDFTKDMIKGDWISKGCTMILKV